MPQSPRRAVAAGTAGLLVALLVLLPGGQEGRVGALSLEDGRLSSLSRCPALPPLDPDDCQHGTTRDHCGRDVCAKGPGERCGGPFNIHGRCGDGMHCRCERCIGCSTYTWACDSGVTACLS